MNVKDYKYKFYLKEKIFIKHNGNIVPVKVLYSNEEPEYYIKDDVVYICIHLRNMLNITMGSIYLPIKESAEEFKRMINNEYRRID